jgi:hypothetical protein
MLSVEKGMVRQTNKGRIGSWPRSLTRCGSSVL